MRDSGALSHLARLKLDLTAKEASKEYAPDVDEGDERCDPADESKLDDICTVEQRIRVCSDALLVY